MNAVRLAVKALIIRDGRLLAVRNRDADRDWYLLPGGGQRAGETIPEALRRECLEEIGTDVIVGRLRFIRDYIARHHEFAATEGDVHQVELMFDCAVLSEPSIGSEPDTMQTGVAWLELKVLSHYRLFPRVLQQVLGRNAPAGEPVYLGDVN